MAVGIARAVACTRQAGGAPSRVPKQRFEPRVHVRLNVTVEEAEAGLVRE